MLLFNRQFNCILRIFNFYKQNSIMLHYNVFFYIEKGNIFFQYSQKSMNMICLVN